MTAYFSMLAPEIVLLLTAGLILIIGVLPGQGLRKSVPALTLVAVGAALVLTWLQGMRPGLELPGIEITGLTQYIRLGALGVGLLSLLVNCHLPGPHERSEHLAMILFSLAGVTLSAAASDLITLFLALELASVPIYILVATSSPDPRAQEAGMKYLFLGSLATAVLLYGFSFLYGATGSCILSDMTDRLDMRNTYALAGMLLALAGLAYKITAVPLHFYAPDVYQGAAAAVVGWLGFAPKLAGFAALLKLLAVASPLTQTASAWSPPAWVFWLLWIMAAVTMSAGNFLALRQTNLKRLLACSSIAHSGYMLVAVLAGPSLNGGPFNDGWSAVLFYACMYGLMNLGTFAAVAALRCGGKPLEHVHELAGLGRRLPMMAILLTLCLLSLLGMPPLAGFVGKVLIFTSTISATHQHPYAWAMITLLVIGVLNTAVGAAYYLRVISTCYLSEPAEEVTISTDRPLRIGLIVCTLLLLIAGISPQRFLISTGSMSSAAAGPAVVQADR